MKRLDKRFDEITIKEIPLKIAEAFLDLESEIRIIEHRTMDVDENTERMIKIKANQMKTELNAFIDSQVKRITSQLNIQSNSDFLSSEELGVMQNQQKK